MLRAGLAMEQLSAEGKVGSSAYDMRGVRQRAECATESNEGRAVATKS